MNVVPFSYDSTNYYLVQVADGWLMIDCGWAGTFPKLAHRLKQIGVVLSEIKFLVLTHLHPDHAGLAQDIKEHGARLLLHECQVPFVGELRKYFKPHHNFKEISPECNTVVTGAQSRAFLKAIGIDGELVQTPGHSPDSISLIIDGSCAFTGDLPRPEFVDAASLPQVTESWDRIRRFAVKRIYPGHGCPFSLSGDGHGHPFGS